MPTLLDWPRSAPPGFRRDAVAPTLADRSWKEVTDVVLAAILIVATAPLIALAMALVRLTSRGPVLYRQVRLGLDGRPFVILKVRTMFDDCESRSGVRWSAPGDTRVTRVGRFLRRTHLDELPQLWNVLRGEMSLIGPRPERPELVARIEPSLPRYRDRLAVKPGVTGLAQVLLPPDVEVASVRRKLAHDLNYIRLLSPWLDLRILAATALHVVGVPASMFEGWLPAPGRDEAGRADDLGSLTDGEAIRGVQPI